MKDNLTSIGSQVRYHSNRLDQIARLIHAAESDEDIAYLARLLALCSLPRTNPGNRKEYVRTNGPFTLALTGPDPAIPRIQDFAQPPRCILRVLNDYLFLTICINRCAAGSIAVC